MKRHYLECQTNDCNNFNQITGDWERRTFITCYYANPPLKLYVDDNNEVDCPILDNEEENKTFVDNPKSPVDDRGSGRMG